MLNGGTLNYFAVPWGIINNPLPLVVVTLIEVGLLGAAEKYRCDFPSPKHPGSVWQMIGCAQSSKSSACG